MDREHVPLMDDGSVEDQTDMYYFSVLMIFERLENISSGVKSSTVLLGDGLGNRLSNAVAFLDVIAEESTLSSCMRRCGDSTKPLKNTSLSISQTKASMVASLPLVSLGRWNLFNNQWR